MINTNGAEGFGAGAIKMKFGELESGRCQMKISFTPTQHERLRELADQLKASALQAEEAREELRRCHALTHAGDRCKGFVVWNAAEPLCASHLHRTRHTAAEIEAEPPTKKRRAAPTCECPAYDWPHRRGKGLCLFPNAPTAQHPTLAGKRAAGKVRRRKWNRIREKYGV